MKIESRTQKAKKNTIAATLAQLFIMIMGFFVPGLVIKAYGSDVNGLTSNINSVLSIINLMQAGIVGASIYEMYKPITEKDEETVGAIYYSSKRYFDRLSILFFILCLLCIPQIVSGTELNSKSVVFAAIVMSINATMQFKFFCCYDLLFSAHQKRYYIDIAVTMSKIIYYLIVFLSIWLKIHFIILYIAVLIGDLFRLFFLKRQFNKCFREALLPYKHKTDYKIKNQLSLFGNQIIQNIVEAAQILLTTSFWGLKYSSVISIYIMVINAFKVISTTAMNAISSSFGDLSSQGDYNRTVNIYRLIQLATMVGTFLFGGCCILMVKPFVRLYTLGVSDIEYSYVGISIVITFYLASYMMYLPFNMMTTSLGKYRDVLKDNIIIGCITLALSIVLIKLNFQVAYLCAGLYYFVNAVERYAILKKNGYNNRPDMLICQTVFIVMIPVFGICSERFIHVDSWKEWVFSSAIVFTAIVILISLLCAMFFKNEVKQVSIYLRKRD